jgi:hypothetical protein
MSKKANNFVVEREMIEKNGKTFYTYFIKGRIRETDVKIAVTPPDFGGYTVLDIVYGKEMKADLVSVPYELKDSSGNLITGNSYLVRSVDENGEVYECKIKPFRASDKALLQMLMR